MITGIRVVRIAAGNNFRSVQQLSRNQRMSSLSGVILPYEPSGNQTSSILQKYWASAGLQDAKKNATRVIWEENGVTGLVSLGNDFSKKAEDEKRESYKLAVASGLNRLVDADVKEIAVEVGAYPHAAGEVCQCIR